MGCHRYDAQRDENFTAGGIVNRIMGLFDEQDVTVVRS